MSKLLVMFLFLSFTARNMYYFQNYRAERSDHRENTASRQLSKVKPYMAWSVLLWGTKWEYRVTFYFFT